MVLRILAFVEDPRPLGHVSCGAKSVRQNLLKVLAHHGKLLGVMAIALIDLIIQGPLGLSLTKQRIAHWASIDATWFVFAALGNVASAIKRLNKGIKVGAIVA